MSEQKTETILKETGFCMHGNEPITCQACKKIFQDRQEKISSLDETQKDQKLKLIREEMDSIIDNLGEPIDAGIKDTVVAFKALDFPTSQSCEGHAEKNEGYPAPWIIISDPKCPEKRYINEDATWEKIAAKYKIPIRDLKRGKNEEVYFEALEELSNNGETEEFQEFRKRNTVLLEKAQKLLTEFYKDRNTSDKLKIITKEIDDGSFRLISQGCDDFDELSQNEREKALQKTTREMKDFTDFMMNKFKNV